MRRIVQCVPNISEGRRQDVIDAVTAPLRGKEGFKCVGIEPDADYNRTVITLIGDPEAMIEPLLDMYAKALELIDMRHHKGEHPRMGAVDVCPFIPIEGVTEDDATLYARRLAEQVSKTLDIPVYLYGLAATSPERVSLPTIRKGEFEGLADKMRDPDWTPDAGPSAPHVTFGATAIGARVPLVAYNIDLLTEKAGIAKRIARAIRKSSGGFQHVQAGPATLSDHVQVTMNILDVGANPIYRIFETVKMEARRDHVTAPSCEIVGLVPKRALTESVAYYMACEGKTFDKDMTLEKLAAESIRVLGLRGFDETKIIEWHI
jgi:glutamate formiminotransferase / 5-formyltetrahydrofolate cyclo-ligase